MSLFAIVALSSCATVPIPDSEVCLDEGDLGAHCFHVLSDKERDITPEAWEVERIAMYCMTTQTLGDWKKIFLKLCHENKRCKPEDIANINSFIDKLETKSAQITKP